MLPELPSVAKPTRAAKKPHVVPPTTLVPITYPLTLYATKVKFKDDYLFIVQSDGRKTRVPYKDVIALERMNPSQVRVTYHRRGDWSVIIGKTEPTRINKYIVRYDRKGMEPIYVRQKET